MSASIDVAAEQRKTILSLLERHLPGTTAWACGSRAKRTSRPTPDLDLGVFATPERGRRIGNLREVFEESDLPFLVDLFVWDEVPKNFRKRIKAERVVLVEKQRRDEGADSPRQLMESHARTPGRRDRADSQQRGIASALRMCPPLGN